MQVFSDNKSWKETGKFQRITCYEVPKWEERYISTLSLTSALDGVGGEGHVPATLPGERVPVSILQEVVWVPLPV
jgi:hypothetical protein